MTLLDSCVVIDLLRGREDALVYVEGLSELPAISAVTATEIVAGHKGTRERRVIDQLLATYRVLDIDLGVATLAGDYLKAYAPSNGLDPIDALVAASATVHELPLATLNLKHFPMFKGLRRPY